MIGSSKAYAGSTGTYVGALFRSGEIPFEKSVLISTGQYRSSNPSFLMEKDGEAVTRLHEGLCRNTFSILSTTLLVVMGGKTPADTIFGCRPRSTSNDRISEMKLSTVPIWRSQRFLRMVRKPLPVHMLYSSVVRNFDGFLSLVFRQDLRPHECILTVPRLDLERSGWECRCKVRLNLVLALRGVHRNLSRYKSYLAFFAHRNASKST